MNQTTWLKWGFPSWTKKPTLSSIYKMPYRLTLEFCSYANIKVSSICMPACPEIILDRVDFLIRNEFIS